MKNNAKKLANSELVVHNGIQRVVVNYATIKRAALTLRALNHSLRKKILETIEAKGEIKVTDIYVKLKLEQSVASQHLAIMRKAGVVTTRRNGKCIYYAVNAKRIGEIVELGKELAQETV